MPLQQISGIVRKQVTRPKDEERLQYIIYDCFFDVDGIEYSVRRSILESLMLNEHTPLIYCKLVEDIHIDSEIELQQNYKQFLKEGFEGGIIRYASSTYEHRRSKSLLKIKETHDAEYKIVNWGVGEYGKADGALMIICETEDGKQFTVTPALPLDERISLAKSMNTIQKSGKTLFAEKYEGKMVIIMYDELSVDKVPVRARTELVIRDYE
jgi:ATP-dependent DNA ligase